MLRYRTGVSPTFGSAVILQAQRPRFARVCVTGTVRGSFDRHMILDQHAIVQHGQRTWLRDLAVGAAFGRVENDLVALPLFRWPAGVHQRSVLAEYKAPHDPLA